MPVKVIATGLCEIFECGCELELSVELMFTVHSKSVLSMFFARNLENSSNSSSDSIFFIDDLLL
jgi:hypothetical protein